MNNNYNNNMTQRECQEKEEEDSPACKIASRDSKSPQVSRILLSILNNAVLWRVSTCSLISNSSMVQTTQASTEQK